MPHLLPGPFERLDRTSPSTFLKESQAASGPAVLSIAHEPPSRLSAAPLLCTPLLPLQAHVGKVLIFKRALAHAEVALLLEHLAPPKPPPGWTLVRNLSSVALSQRPVAVLGTTHTRFDVSVGAPLGRRTISHVFTRFDHVSRHRPRHLFIERRPDMPGISGGKPKRESAKEKQRSRMQRLAAKSAVKPGGRSESKKGSEAECNAACAWLGMGGKTMSDRETHFPWDLEKIAE